MIETVYSGENFIGEVTNVTDTLIPDRAASLARNINIEDGTIKKRNEYVYVGTLPNSKNPKVMKSFISNAGGEVFVAISDGNLYYSTDASAWSVDTGATFNTNIIPDMVSYLNNLYILDGANYPYEFNGKGGEYKTTLPKARCGAVYEGRMFLANAGGLRDVVYFTNIQSLEIEDVDGNENSFQVGKEENSQILRCVTFLGNLLIYKTTSTWGMYGNDPESNYGLRGLSSNIGLADTYAIAVGLKNIIWIHKNRFYTFSPELVPERLGRPIVEQLLNKSLFFDDTISELLDELVYPAVDSFMTYAGSNDFDNPDGTNSSNKTNWSLYDNELTHLLIQKFEATGDLPLTGRTGITGMALQGFGKISGGQIIGATGLGMVFASGSGAPTGVVGGLDIPIQYLSTDGLAHCTLAQSITPSGAININAIEFYHYYNNEQLPAVAQFIVRILGDSSGYPDESNVLANGFKSVSHMLTTSFTVEGDMHGMTALGGKQTLKTTVVLNKAAVLSGSTKYWIIIEHPSPANEYDPLLGVHYHDDVPAISGSLYFLDVSTNTYLLYKTGYDLSFRALGSLYATAYVWESSILDTKCADTEFYMLCSGTGMQATGVSNNLYYRTATATAELVTGSWVGFGGWAITDSLINTSGYVATGKKYSQIKVSGTGNGLATPIFESISLVPTSKNYITQVLDLGASIVKFTNLSIAFSKKTNTPILHARHASSIVALTGENFDSYPTYDGDDISDVSITHRYWQVRITAPTGLASAENYIYGFGIGYIGAISNTETYFGRIGYLTSRPNGYYYDGKYLFNFVSGTGSENNVTLVLDESNNEPQIYNIPSEAVAIFKDRLYFGGGASGATYANIFEWKLDYGTGYMDTTGSGSATGGVTGYWESKDFGVDSLFKPKHFKSIEVAYLDETNGAFTVAYSIDDSSYADARTITSGATNQIKNVRIRLPKDKIGRTIKIKLYSSKKMTIYGFWAKATILEQR